MAANATGHRKTDQLRIIGLVELAADFASEVLAPGGFFLAKVLQGGAEGELLARLKREFATVRHVKPKASRADSAELYLLATGFRGSRLEASDRLSAARRAAGLYAVAVLRPRKPRKPRPAKPSAIIAQVEGSGTAPGTVPSNGKSCSSPPPVKFLA